MKSEFYRAKNSFTKSRKMKKENCVENMAMEGDEEDPFEPVSGERE